MAGSSAFSEAHPPVRSISLPSRMHPTSVKLESTLKHLKTWQIPSAVLLAEAIQNGLVGVAELYNCIEEFIHSQQTQQALLRHQGGKLVEEALDGSVTLLDTCGIARDILMAMKEHVVSLQSAFRRRGGSDSASIESNIAAYIRFRKKGRKDLAKCLVALKKMESKSIDSYSLLDADHHLSFIIKVLRESTSITSSIFRAVILFMSMPTMKTGGWSLISKLFISKRVTSSEQKIINEIEGVDLALSSLHGQSRSSNGSKADEVQIAQRMLHTLDVSIEELEGGLDCMFRCLVQNRVSFLNFLTR